MTFAKKLVFDHSRRAVFVAALGLLLCLAAAAGCGRSAPVVPASPPAAAAQSQPPLSGPALGKYLAQHHKR